MTDFGAGARKRKGSRLPAIVAGVLGLAVVGAVLFAGWSRQHGQDIATARAWAITGPPCPTASAQAFAASAVKPRQAFEFNEVTFAHGYGHASCQQVRDDGGRGSGTHPVCQFTAPAALKVTTRKGSFYFVPPTGPATVAVQDGVPTCVRAAWFRGAANQW